MSLKGILYQLMYRDRVTVLRAEKILVDDGSDEIYNNTEYAAHVEWGHRQKKRFVPGYWKGDRFVYDPSAKTGMMLRPKFIDGAKMLHKAMDETELTIRSDAKRILGGLFQ